MKHPVYVSFRPRSSTCVPVRVQSPFREDRRHHHHYRHHRRLFHACARALPLSLSFSWRGNKKFQRVNGIATAGQSALTMFYCYVTDRVGCTRIHVRDERTGVH